MSNGFVHSVKVPRLYKVTAKTVQTVEEEGASLKQLIYEKKHPNLQGTLGLASTTIQHGRQLDQLLRETQLLVKEPRLDPWLARVLITELLWGKKTLPPEAKPLHTVLAYEKVLRDASKKFDKMDTEVAGSIKVNKPRFVRINTLVKNVEDSIRSFTEEGWTLLPKSRNYSAFLKDLAKLSDGKFIQDFHVPELLAFPPGTTFHAHPGYKCGAIVLQDKASCLPAYLLKPTPGSTVLDMCSAPGMKTTHLAAIMNNTGKIFAVERDHRRYKTLCDMVKMNAADCVTTINADAMKLDPKLRMDIEYVLVDPSCSGSGMLDRNSLGKPDSECAPGRLISLQSFQVLLLRHALLNYPNAKRVVYSTCSIYPEENEMVVDEILENIGDAYELVPIKKLIGPDWKNFSSTDYKCKDRCLYAKPDVELTNGFFVAVFERNFDVPLPEYKRKDAPEKRKNDQESNDAGETQTARKKRRRSRSKGIKVESEITKTESKSVDTAKSGLKTVKEEGSVNKKRKLKAVKTEKGSVADKIPDEEQPKGKKKKLKMKHEIVDIDEDVAVQSAMNGDDHPVEKKKKKRKRNKEQDVEVLVNGNSASSLGEEENIKKKKKKKQSEVEILEEIRPKVEISDKQNSKKKKKKKKSSEVEILEVVSQKAETFDDQQSKKKKKKKKKQPE